jgi:hypothetical protein
MRVCGGRAREREGGEIETSGYEPIHTPIHWVTYGYVMKKRG